MTKVDKRLLAEEPVYGPSASEDNTVAIFDGTTGKLVKDSGILIADIGSGDLTGPESSTNNRLAVFDGVTGKVISEADGLSVAEKEQARIDIGADSNGLRDIETSNTLDLNDLTSPGKFKTLVGPNNPNLPILGFFYIENDRWSDNVTQRLTPYHVDGRLNNTYIRSRYNGVWTEWKGITYTTESDMFRGFSYAMNATNPTTRIDIRPGICRDSTNQYTINLTSNLIKRADSIWAEGSNNGLIDITPVSGFYWLHVIYNPTTRVVDALASQSINSPLLPSGFISRRVIGGFALISAGVGVVNIYGFINDGEWHRYILRAPSVDTQPNSGAVNPHYRVMAAPLGAKLELELMLLATAPTGGMAGAVTVRDPDLGTFVSDNNALFNHADWFYQANEYAISKIRVFSDNQARVLTGDNNANGVITLRTEGWRLDRSVYL